MTFRLYVGTAFCVSFELSNYLVPATSAEWAQV